LRFRFWADRDSLAVDFSAWRSKMARPRDERQKDLLRPALEAIIDLGHPTDAKCPALDN